MNNAPVAAKAKGPRQYEAKAKEAPKVVSYEISQPKVAISQNIEITKTNTIKLEAEKLPFGIKSSQINKYIVYGEILATPACRKQRNR